MSHVVSISTRINDPVAVAAACTRLGLPQPTQGTARLYSGDVTGLLVQLPGWQYPIAIDTQNGTVQFDHFEGRWGDEAQLHRFLQVYAVEKCRQESRQRGLQVHEQTLPDGSVRLQIVEGQLP